MRDDAPGEVLKSLISPGSQSAFLAAYERERPLAGWELQALGPFQAARSTVALGIPAAHIDEWGSSAVPARLVDRLVDLAQKAIVSPDDP